MNDLAEAIRRWTEKKSRQCRSTTLRSPVASLSISGGEAIAATLVVPGKQSNPLSTLWFASPVYDPAEKPRTSMSLIPSGMDAVTY